MDRSKQTARTSVKQDPGDVGLGEYLAGLPKQLDNWMFGHASPVTMGILRLTIGFLAFANLLLISVGFEDWFTEKGFVPQEVAHRYAGDVWRINLLSNVYDGRITLVFYILITISAFLTMIGLWSRISSAVLLVGMITLHHRNLAILHGGDVVLRMAILYVALSPSGAACSVDRLLKLWKGKAPAIPLDVSMWPQRLMQLQIAIIYYTTVWGKWMGLHWKDGTAVYYPLHLNEFDKFWLPQFVRDNEFMVKAATYGTLLVELSLATIAFYKPLRKYALLGGLGLHLFIEYSMNIPLFAFVMLATYLSFFDGEEMSSFASRVGERIKKLRIRLFAPKDQHILQGPKLALQAMDPFNLVEYAEGGDNKSWESIDGSGKVGSARKGLIRSIGAWPMALLPKLWVRVLNKSLE